MLRITQLQPTVTITWNATDVHVAREELGLPKCSDKEAIVFLNTIYKPLQDRSVETGWEVIKDLLQQQQKEEQ